MNTEKRIELINHIARWCYDNTESWEVENIGASLAYLFWAIAADDGEALDTTIGNHTTLVRILNKNPNKLLDTLTKHKFLIINK